MNMQRIDAHQHFWRLARGDYHWLTPDFDILYRDYLPEHLVSLMHQANVHKTILVQATDSVSETRYMLELATDHDFIAGVVGWINMRADDAVAQLRQLNQHHKFKGIRPMLQDLPDPAWMLDNRLTPVFQTLIDNNLCFDALIKPVHLPYLDQLLQRYPKLKVVIDHAAKPDISGGKDQHWHHWISDIAANHNVYCKLSGLVTEAGKPVSYERIYPYMNHLLNHFGPSRLLFGSDWPVINLASDYLSWIDYIEEFVHPLPQEQQQAIWHHNATTFYALGG